MCVIVYVMDPFFVPIVLNRAFSHLFTPKSQGEHKGLATEMESGLLYVWLQRDTGSACVVVAKTHVS
jgi:hypothetical protein